MKVILFTRHELTATQRAEILDAWQPLRAEGELLELVDLKELASVEILTREDAYRIARQIGDVGAIALYGVLPVPIRWALQLEYASRPDQNLQVYESWNVRRSTEGGKPTFEHKEWLITTEY